MKRLNVTLDSAEQNLALDEALLLAMEDNPRSEETLRIWEPRSRHVVLGRGSKCAVETRLDACRRDSVPVFRRSTGGAAILAGPGCLFYSVILSRDQRPELHRIDRIHEFVLARQARGLGAVVTEVTHAGTSDLVVPVGPDRVFRKFSGNSLRIRREAILYHGTILYNFPLEDIPKYLGTPSRQPNYRERRSHEDFVVNLPTTAHQATQAIIESWCARETLTDWPQNHVAELVATKYACDEWNLGL